MPLDTVFIKPYIVPAATQVKFDKVIEKCSRLIQFYPDSKWVDDAILMIGESYVYLGEYESGIRKFAELIENFPQSDLRFEAKLWYAKAEYFMNREDEVLKILNDLIPEATSAGEENILLNGYIIEGQLYSERGEYDQATIAYEKAVGTSGDEGEKARAQFQLGICYEKLGDTSRAAKAYGRVLKFKPGNSLKYQTRLKQGITLTTLGLYDDALAVFIELTEEQLKNEEIGLVELEIANTYWAMGDSSKAFSLYEYIDTTYKRTDASAKSFYRRGLIFEKKSHDFKLALDFYSKARSEFASSEITNPAQLRADALSRYFSYQSLLTKYDSLFLSETTKDTTNIDDPKSGSSKDSVTTKIQSRVSSGHVTEDSISASIIKREILSDSLREQQKTPDSHPDQFHLAEVTPPDSIPSKTDTTAKSVAMSGTDSLLQMKLPKDSLLARGDSVQKDQASPVIVPAISPDSIKSLIAQNQFELAGLFLLELDLPDSALFWFNKVVHEHPASKFVPRSFYALAEIYRMKGDSSQVDSIYNIILEKYEDSEYAAQIRKHSGLEEWKNLVDPAEDKYQEAETLLVAGRSLEALENFKKISKDHPTSPFTPKAQFTVGWIYENVSINLDSASVWYRKLLKNYPASVYASEVQPKIAVLEDSTKLQQYIKINEIQAVAKPEKQQYRKGTAPSDKQIEDPQNLQQRLRRNDRNVEEDPDEEEPEEDEADPDDDN